ncbi:MAG: hypothetical protein HOP09_14695 [Hyphomicrobium sp.]|nr:hypothetical protein [Hyphomicrobium sp.]
MQIDAYIDPLTGDLPIRGRLTSGSELIKQRITVRLRRGTGEYLLDPNNVGLPLIEWMDTKPPPLAQIMSRLQAEMRSVPGVVATGGWTASHDPLTGRVTCNGDVQFDDGTVTSVVALGTPGGNINSMPFGVFFSQQRIHGGR